MPVNSFGFTTPATATTRAPTASTPGWTGDLSQYALPKIELGQTSAEELVSEPLKATIASAPALQKVADIVSAINQKSWMSAPGRQQGLENIQRWQRGELDPTIYQQEASMAAQRYGTGGFGIDSPAWQAAIQRGLVTNRQALQEKGAAALQDFYSGLPVTDVTRYTLTPEAYASALDAQRARQLQLAELQQKGTLTAAELAQARSLAQQELAFKQSELAQRAQIAAEQRELERALQEGRITSQEKLEADRLAAQRELERAKLYAGLYQAGYRVPGGVSYYDTAASAELARQRALSEAQLRAQQYARSALGGLLPA